jgi:alanine racemase
MSAPVATVDLRALEHNVARLRSYLQPRTQLLAAVKANAYGHGAVETARQLEGMGVAWFGVATAEEALELRAGGIGGRVLVFTPVNDRLEVLIEARVGLEAAVHLKVDTGMGRLGLPPQRAIDLAVTTDSAQGVRLEGVWTHYASADDADLTHTRGQLSAFGMFLAGLEGHGIEVPLKHTANSSALIALPEAHFDMVRPGIALYGYHSSTFIEGLEPDLKPVMTLEAPVTFVKRIAAGTTISYGGLWRAAQDTTIATVRIGYADGYPRAATGRAEVLIRGVRRPVAGRVCMDQLMVDVGTLDVAVGDRVTLFGPFGPTAEDVGAWGQSLSYEVLTRIGWRVQRRFVR